MKQHQAVLFALLLTACGANTETTSIPVNTPDTTSKEVVVAAENPLDISWRNFKIAILDKDEPAIGSYIQSESITSEDLLLTFSDEFYAQKLEETTYDQLTATEWEGKAVKEFRAEQSYTDEDGNTYESAIFLYFEEQESSLKLVGVLMAG